MSVSWNNDRELALLECYQAEPVLWQTQHKDHKNKSKVQEAWVRISNIMDIPVADLKRKKDSLMSSYRTYKKKVKDSMSSGVSSDGVYKPVWFAFDTIESFLGKGVSSNENSNSTLAEFQADEEIEFGARMKAAAAASSPPVPKPVKALRVAASAPPPLPPSAHPMMWPEQPLPRLRPGLNADECQIFGDFVASELRTLRSESDRRRLKRIIQKAILQIGEEEDGSLMCG